MVLVLFVFLMFKGFIYSRRKMFCWINKMRFVADNLFFFMGLFKKKSLNRWLAQTISTTPPWKRISKNIINRIFLIQHLFRICQHICNFCVCTFLTRQMLLYTIIKKSIPYHTRKPSDSNWILVVFGTTKNVYCFKDETFAISACFRKYLCEWMRFLI